MSDWPIVFREVHLLGGGYAINSPEEKDKVFIFPNTLTNQTAVLTLKNFNQLYSSGFVAQRFEMQSAPN